MNDSRFSDFLRLISVNQFTKLENALDFTGTIE